MTFDVLVGTTLLLLAAPLDTRALDRPPTPEEKAIAYLVREVPRWSRENRCHSCHNDGDGARALYQARALRLAVPDEALSATTAWLAQPLGWDRNGGEGPFSDKHLARLQFTLALAAATASEGQALRAPLLEALDGLVAAQRRDGSWAIDTGNALGGPTTWGSTLATALARRALQDASGQKYGEAVKRADAWLRAAPAANVMDAAAITMGLETRPRDDCLQLLRDGQSRDGGWGPYVQSPSENFDTAIALIALAAHRQREGLPEMIRKGRAYLIAQQRADGSWMETTRPSGGDSYAQRVSTSAWATSALLATKPD